MKMKQNWVKMKDYEKQRMKQIQENKARLRAAGIFEMKKLLNDSVKKTTVKANDKRKVLEEDENDMLSGGSEGLSISSEEENNLEDEELVIKKRSMSRKNRRLNMSEVIAHEMGHDKTYPAVDMFRPNTRSRVAQETRSHTNLNEGVIFRNGSTTQVTEMHQANPNTRVSLFQSPMRSVPHNSEQVEVIQSDMPLDGGEPTGTVKATKSTTKIGRTWAKPWSAWDNGVKKILEWSEDCQPLGPLESKLMSHLGNLARNGDLFPLTMLSWLDADKKVLNQIWDSVKVNTNAPEGFKDRCFMKIGTYWRHFKHRIKRDHYKKFQTDDERLTHVPPRVEVDQWAILVRYWGLEKTNKRATQNSKNRESQCAYSRTGRTSHAIIIDGMVKQGKLVDQITIWNATRNPKNKSFSSDDGALHRAEHLERQLNELSEEDRNDPETRNTIFMDVVGRDGHGHALLKGVGTKLASKQPNPSSSILMDEIAQLRKEAEDREILHEQVVEEREALHKQETEEREARHQQELKQMKDDMRHEIFSWLKNAGIQVLDYTPSTPTNLD